MLITDYITGKTFKAPDINEDSPITPPLKEIPIFEEETHDCTGIIQ
jgi:hypothetical protein